MEGERTSYRWRVVSASGVWDVRMTGLDKTGHTQSWRGGPGQQLTDVAAAAFGPSQPCRLRGYSQARMPQPWEKLVRLPVLS